MRRLLDGNLGRGASPRTRVVVICAVLMLVVFALLVPAG
jgi:hypothetical protein